MILSRLIQHSHGLRTLKLQRTNSMRIILDEKKISKLKWLDAKGWIKYNMLVFLYKIKSESRVSSLNNITKHFEGIHNFAARNKNNFCLTKRK